MDVNVDFSKSIEDYDDELCEYYSQSFLFVGRCIFNEILEKISIVIFE